MICVIYFSIQLENGNVKKSCVVFQECFQVLGESKETNCTVRSLSQLLEHTQPFQPTATIWCLIYPSFFFTVTKNMPLYMYEASLLCSLRLYLTPLLSCLVTVAACGAIWWLSPAGWGCQSQSPAYTATATAEWFLPSESHPQIASLTRWDG